MVKTDFLKLVIDQAARNGFSLERWVMAWLKEPWTSEAATIEFLTTHRRYYCLLFSHDFARAFWKQGTRITFMVPSASYTRRNTKGDVVEVKRKAYTRRRLKPDAWKYHLREMAACDEPLRYVRRYVLIAAETTEEPKPVRATRNSVR